jgi:hypothetical protein
MKVPVFQRLNRPICGQPRAALARCFHLIKKRPPGADWAVWRDRRREGNRGDPLLTKHPSSGYPRKVAAERRYLDDRTARSLRLLDDSRMARMPWIDPLWLPFRP